MPPVAAWGTPSPTPPTPNKSSSSQTPSCPYPLLDWSISENLVDYVVQVEAIGDPKGILSGTTRITRDPVGLVRWTLPPRSSKRRACRKTASPSKLAPAALPHAAASLKEIMLREQIHGSFALGGITGYLVEMLRAGCFRQLMDVQCFDLDAAASIRDDPRHREISANHYAGPGTRGRCGGIAWMWSSWVQRKSIRTSMSTCTPIPTVA
ncbi:MAG: citrate lyase subunit alpha [Oscillospiraceae bacterium]